MSAHRVNGIDELVSISNHRCVHLFCVTTLFRQAVYIMTRHVAQVAATGNTAYGLGKGYKTQAVTQKPKISRRKGVSSSCMSCLGDTFFYFCVFSLEQ